MRSEIPARPTARVSELSRHFVEQFIRRVGEEPTLEMVNRLLSGSKRISRHRTLYKLINGDYVPYQQLGGFWNHEAGIIMLVNEHACRAVTVYTPNDEYPERPRLPYDVRRKKWLKKK